MSAPPIPTDALAWLEANGAQRDVIDGLRARLTSNGESTLAWDALWRGCPRGDWLLGIAARLGVDHRALVRAARGSARIADCDAPEAIALLDRVDAWLESDAETSLRAEIAARSQALEGALDRAPDPASAAAMQSVLAVGLGIDDRDVLAMAPAAAAEATILATIDCGYELAMRWAHDKTAAAVREAIPWTDVADALARARA